MIAELKQQIANGALDNEDELAAASTNITTTTHETMNLILIFI